MSASPRLPLPVVGALVAVLSLSACGGDSADVQRLQEDLSVQAKAQSSLRERIQELEGIIVAAEDSGVSAGQALTDLEDRLEGMGQELAQLRIDLDEARTAREDADAEHGASISSLDQRILTLEETVAEFESLIERLRRDLLDLSDEHGLLRAEFDQHKRNHG